MADEWEGNIQGAREIACSLLKPSRNQMEHGAELHRDALVCDAYGFAPRAGVDSGRLNELIAQGASARELLDLRVQMMRTSQLTTPADREEYLKAWEAAGVTCLFQDGAIGHAPALLMKPLALGLFALDMLGERVRRACVPRDITAAKKAGEHCVYLTLNSVPLAENWISVAEELSYIQVFFQMGCRMMHIAYNRRNVIGDGCAETSNAGLSDFGRAVIAEMNRVGVIVDLAHSGWQTSLEAARLSKAPVVASHSGAAGVNNHYRCLPDEVITAIAEKGGYVGVCCLPGFLGKSGDINAFLDHIDYIARKFGPDYVAIGTDRSYCCRSYLAEMVKVKKMPSQKMWHEFWRPNEAVFDPHWTQPEKMQSLAWTNWPLFTTGLVKRGYTEDDIRKIIGGNVLRVAQAALAASEIVPDHFCQG